jgi:hypothetical protein
MARRKLEDHLINREDIAEELRLIDGSDTDYISPAGNVYKDYNDGKFFKKSNFINNKNGYLYTSVTYKDKQRQRRVNVLVGSAYLDNPDNLPVVMHKDNNKANPHVSNLKWGTISENTRDAFRDGLARNAKGYEDSQSMPVIVYDRNFNEVGKYGSVSECSRALGITKTGILYSCKNEVSSKSKSGYYFRFDK